MKQKVFSLLAFLMLWNLLLAHGHRPWTTAQPGDWFKIFVAQTSQLPDYGSKFNLTVSYKKEHADGSRDYTITFDRIRTKLSTDFGAVGYDSYYPTYKQRTEKIISQPSYSLKVDSQGTMLTLRAEGKFPAIEMYEITPRKEFGGISMTEEPINKAVASSVISSVLRWMNLGNISRSECGFRQVRGWNILLTGASFKMPPNVLIEGKLTNMPPAINGKVFINLARSSKQLKIQPDGTFKFSVSLSEDTGAELVLLNALVNDGEKEQSSDDKAKDGHSYPDRLLIPLFIEPGDTLRIVADGADLNKPLVITGNAAKKTRFALALSRMGSRVLDLPKAVKGMNARELSYAQDQIRRRFNKVVAEHTSQLSVNVRNYYQHKFDFEQADDRLEFLLLTRFQPSIDSPKTEMFEGFPKCFFKTIDTLPILMIDYNKPEWYLSFLRKFKLYNSTRNSQYSGGNKGFFLGDYVLALNRLMRFPLYFSLSDSFRDELVSSNWKEAQDLAPYYSDFINNCRDTSLTKEVIEKWQILEKWAVGNPSPLKTIRLKDGKILSMEKYKGKVLSITFNFHFPDEIKRLFNRIKKQDPAKVHFLIAQLDERGFPPSSILDSLKKFPHVTYVEIGRSDLKDAVLLDYFDIKTFVIDAEQKVVEDNIDDQPSNIRQDDAVFEKAIQKALVPRKKSYFNKLELRFIGWSVGSILFSGLIFFLIYRVRVSHVQKRESLKRRIKDLEVKAIRSQMNPHFMFNALNSIQSLINEHEYTAANVYLEKFSMLTRQVLNNSERPFISLSEEIEAVSLYSDLEKLRFDFDFLIEISPSLTPTLIEIPGMIIQPLIENAILHGIGQVGREGVIEVLINREDDFLKVTVRDNGGGLHGENVNKVDGFGLKLLRERLALLDNKNTKGTLEIKNGGIGGFGVTAVLKLPVD